MRRTGALTSISTAVLGIALGASARAQVPSSTPGERSARQAEALRVFVDCTDVACDFDFFRTEIGLVNHVLDRQSAQVLVLVTTQPTDAGGTEYTVTFTGQQSFRGADDSLRYVARPATSEDQLRRALADLLKRGLVRYVNHTPFGEGIRVSYPAPAQGQAAPVAARDRWKAWSFATTLNGSFSGERSYRYTSINASLSANRITKAWKINTSLQVGHSENTIRVSGSPTVSTASHDYGLNGIVVKSLNGHWSVGARATVTSSTFLNQSLALRLAPAVEYNVFPYSQSTRRQATIQYSVGVTAFDYAEETIFGKVSEALLDQKLVASLGVIKPWGSIATSVEGSFYLHDLAKHRAVLVNNINLHLFGGFSLMLLGGLEAVHDQLYLPKQGASDTEILLQQRQLATSFRYWSSIGFSYRFGSPFANVVNPRFAGSSGGTSILQ